REKSSNDFSCLGRGERTARLTRRLGRVRFPARSNKNCYFGSGYHVNVKLYVCKRTHDAGENPRVGQ
ncbi:hypothetical protein SFRURICE_003697, partial [Spodoptera frugiperda]